MDIKSFLPMTLIRKARRYARKLWVRVVLMGMVAFVALGVALLLERLVPTELARTLNGEAADRLLQIIANAMLAVTTFSLGVMVSVYRSTSTQWTPRVHRLIIEDRTTQNTLAVFIGAYVYALVAIILRELDVFVDSRAFVLFWITAIVLGVIVVYLIRWVLHLQSFGSLIDVTRQIEQTTRGKFQERLKNPCMGANAMTGDIPEGATAILAEQSGYVEHIYPEALNAAAEAHGKDVYLVANIGRFVFINEPLAHVIDRGRGTKEETEYETFKAALYANIVIGDLRTFDQDPRFGLIAMGEVGSKALSPGVNDAGTAIDVIHRIGRILSSYKNEGAGDCVVRLAHLYIPPLDPDDLLDDAFGAISRDGAGVIEVQQRLQVTLSGLRRHPDEGMRDSARRAAEIALERALKICDFDPDHQRLCGSADADVVDAVMARIRAKKG